MLDDAVEFFQEFIQAEFEMARAAYGEPDTERYAEKYADFERFMKDVKPMDACVREVGDLRLKRRGADEWFAKGKEVLAQLRPRTLFQVKQYVHPELGDLFRAYVSHTRAAIIHVYGSSVYATEVDGEFRIVSDYATCGECSMTGKIKGRPCRECGASGWRFMEGLRIEITDKPVGVRKLQRTLSPLKSELQVLLSEMVIS